jgi:hypothetical protein
MDFVIKGDDLPVSLVLCNNVPDISTTEEPDAQHHYNIHNAIG